MTWVDSPEPAEGEVIIFDRGTRYSIGYGSTYCAVWDERGTGRPEISRWPKTDEGWSAAFARYARLESRVLGAGASPTPSQAPASLPLPVDVTSRARGAWRSPRMPRQRSSRSTGEARSRRAASNREIEYLFFAIGGLMLAASTFLPWVSATFQTYNLFGLTSAASSLPWLPVAMLGLGIGIAASAIRRVTLTKLSWAAGATAMGLLVLGGVDVVNLFRSAESSGGQMTVGVGIFAGVGAVILLAAGSIRVHREESRQ